MDTGKETEKLPPRIESAPIPQDTKWETELSGEDQSFSKLVLYSIRYTSGEDLTYALLQRMWGISLHQVASWNWKTLSGSLGQFKSRHQKPDIALFLEF